MKHISSTKIRELSDGEIVSSDSDKKIIKSKKRKHERHHRKHKSSDIKSNRKRSNNDYRDHKHRKSRDSKSNKKSLKKSSDDDINLDDLVDQMFVNEEDLLEKRRRERQILLEKLMAKESLQNKSNPKSENLGCITSPATCSVEEKNDSELDVCKENKSSPSLSEIENNANQDVTYDKTFDMFADDDIFHADFNKKFNHLTNNGTFMIDANKLADNCDDGEGYYREQIGEIINNRYQVIGMAGKGVFSNVLRAKNIKSLSENNEVVIKLLRNNDLMKKQGYKEIEILKLINENDNNKFHCLSMLDVFQHKQHLCIVLEPLYMNLRELIRKYGNGVGLNIKAVRAYTFQIFQALKLLKRLKIIHADIKPDNIMVNHTKTQIKLCDFGSAFYVHEVEPTPYLVSRFYRSPEIVLALAYNHPADMWSVGCTVYELFTGKITFPARNNNELLKMFMDLKGKVSHKMIRKSPIKHLHFDDSMNFVYRELNKETNKERPIVMSFIQQSRDLNQILRRSYSGSDINILKKVDNLKDMLDKMFTIDPVKRLTVNDALLHNFIIEKI